MKPRRFLLPWLGFFSYLLALASCSTSSLSTSPCVDFCNQLLECQPDDNTVDCGESCEEGDLSGFEKVYCCVEYLDCTLFNRCTTKTDGSSCDGALKASGDLDGTVDGDIEDDPESDGDTEAPLRPYDCRNATAGTCDFKEGICEINTDASALSSADVAPCCEDVDCGCNDQGACLKTACEADGFDDRWCPDDPDRER